MSSTILLRVAGLSAWVSNKEVLSDFALDVLGGEVVALMGANGSGKTTLAQILLGNPSYKTVGKIYFEQRELLGMSIDERAKRGLFVAWQNPVSVPGVSILSYLRVAYEANGHKIEKLVKFRDQVRTLLLRVGLKEELLNRSLNDGFSGGEKKRFELLQLLLFRPKLAVLDEIDSGLDVDGLRMVSEIVEELKQSGTAFILITHYKKLIDYVSVDRVLVLSQGMVVADGRQEIVEEIEKEGYAKYGKAR